MALGFRAIDHGPAARRIERTPHDSTTFARRDALSVVLSVSWRSSFDPTPQVHDRSHESKRHEQIFATKPFRPSKTETKEHLSTSCPMTKVAYWFACAGRRRIVYASLLPSMTTRKDGRRAGDSRLTSLRRRGTAMEVSSNRGARREGRCSFDSIPARAAGARSRGVSSS